MAEGGDDRGERVGESLKRAIKDSGISISELARRTRVARQAINRFLSGERGLTTETVDRLCEELGLVLVPAKAAKGPPPSHLKVAPSPEQDVKAQRVSDELALFRCKYFLSKLDDRNAFSYNPIWSDIIRRTRHSSPMFHFLMEVRGFGSDKQRAAVLCLVLSILEMNSNCEKLLANEHLPGFLRYLVTQAEDPLCIGSLGAVLNTSDIYAWINTLPAPEPDEQEAEDEWIG